MSSHNNQNTKLAVLQGGLGKGIRDSYENKTKTYHEYKQPENCNSNMINGFQARLKKNTSAKLN